MHSELRFAAHPADAKSYDTARIRKDFLVENLFTPDKVTLVYSMYDRFIVGGIMPSVNGTKLETFDELKAEFFLQRREIGFINVGGPAIINSDGVVYELKYKEALYLGRGNREVVLASKEVANPARLYFNSAPAHIDYPNKIVTKANAEMVELGSPETSNHRTINKLIVNSVLKTCQLQMGMTELKPGSVWNTMPSHTHNRRMEAYFYFEVPEKQAVCHFMGEPTETRHIWIKNQQAVISPAWSIHSGAGTSNYCFIWGMAGENLDYGDMDVVQPSDLR